MTVYFKEDRQRWCYNFSLNGKRYNAYCVHPDTAAEPKNKKQARDIESFIRDRLKRKTNAPAKYGYSLAEAAAWFADNHAKHLTTWKDVLCHIRELLNHFGASTDINAITDEDIAEYTTWCRAQPRTFWVRGAAKPTSGTSKYLKSTGRKRSPSTVNQYLKVLRQILNTPMARKHCQHQPYIKLLKEPKRIPTPINHEDVEKILKHAMPHLQKTIILAVHTGMRAKEALTLKTKQFNMDQGIIYLDATTKARKGREIPTNSVALEVIKQCIAMGDTLWAHLQADKALAEKYAKEFGIKTRGDVPLILYQRNLKNILRPVDGVKTAWTNALQRAELPKTIRFHDTRASFCSYLAQAGVHVLTIQKLAGHEDVKTTMRYIGAGDANLRDAVNLLAEKRPLGV